MNGLMLSTATEMPLAILIPLIMAVAIGTVVVVQWIYKKINKNK